MINYYVRLIGLVAMMTVFSGFSARAQRPIFHIMDVFEKTPRQVSQVLGRPVESLPPEPGGRDPDTIRVYRPAGVAEVSIEYTPSGISEDVQVVMKKPVHSPHDALVALGITSSLNAPLVNAPAGKWWVRVSGGKVVNRIGVLTSSPGHGWDTVQVQRYETPHG